jgi:hypothetical protein
MRRRAFIAGLGAAVWPLAARAQQAAIPVIGLLHTNTPDVSTSNLTAFDCALRLPTAACQLGVQAVPKRAFWKGAENCFLLSAVART